VHSGDSVKAKVQHQGKWLIGKIAAEQGHDIFDVVLDNDGSTKQLFMDEIWFFKKSSYAERICRCFWIQPFDLTINEFINTILSYYQYFFHALLLFFPPIL
jgi:hypothetical protein